jgi:flavin reductase (DIM6/NTAB) family NADH-FMN oxidoreductase RutF
MTQDTTPTAPGSDSRDGGAPKHARASVAGGEFRNAMSRIGAAVHIVTTAGTAGKCGFTGSSICSVSDAPPAMLFCLNRASGMNQAFRDNGVFCINTLAAGHEMLADEFAGLTEKPMQRRFAGPDWDTLKTGAPALKSALVSFDCQLTAIEEIATHSVVFGQVIALRTGPQKPALIYIDRDYRSL